MLGRIDFLKKNMQSSQENTWAGVFLIKVQVFNLHSESLFEKETAALVLSCEFGKSFKNTFFLEQPHASTILALLKCDIQFIVHFSPTFVTFQRFYQTQ